MTRAGVGQTRFGTGPRNDPADGRAFARKRQQMIRDGARGSLPQELRRFGPSIVGVDRRVSECFVGEEGKKMVLDDRATQTSADLIEAIRNALVGAWSAGTVVSLKCVESWPIELDERAAVIFVGSIL